MTATVAVRPRWRKWLVRLLIALGLIVALLLAAFTAVGGWGLIESPKGAFDAKLAPPAPDYAHPAAWLAWPGRNGLERSTPAGLTAVAEADAPADVFFVHPTTFKGNKVWVARYDEDDKAAPLNAPVLLDQVSAFNGCCRMYAPRYRQTSIAGLKLGVVKDVAYADVAAAFRYYIAHLNHGRPFILASHSQGTAHAIRLVQDEILNTPLKARMVVAYLIGGYVPDTFAQVGLPVCADATATGCVVSWNTSQQGRTGARMITRNKVYWWRGAWTEHGQSDALCVNPLNWAQGGAAPAKANLGSLPFPQPPFGKAAKTMAALIPNLTGAACKDGLLEVDVPWSAPAGFTDKLSWLLGSYHLNDYGIFYDALRRNAVARVAAWQAVNPPSPER